MLLNLLKTGVLCLGAYSGPVLAQPKKASTSISSVTSIDMETHQRTGTLAKQAGDTNIPSNAIMNYEKSTQIETNNNSIGGTINAYYLSASIYTTIQDHDYFLSSANSINLRPFAMLALRINNSSISLLEITNIKKKFYMSYNPPTTPQYDPEITETIYVSYNEELYALFGTYNGGTYTTSVYTPFTDKQTAINAFAPTADKKAVSTYFTPPEEEWEIKTTTLYGNINKQKQGNVYVLLIWELTQLANVEHRTGAFFQDDANSAWVYETLIDMEGANFEVVDIAGLGFSVLTMPFTFISTAFNLTLFAGTPYQINISNLFLSLIAILIFILLIKKILGMKS